MKIDKIDITIGSSHYNTIRNTNLELEKPFKEYIDNSTQSYLDNKKILDQLPSFPGLIISILFQQDKIIIEDNAFGMDRPNFDRAMRLGGKSAEYSENSRGQYGVGLKNASLYLGDTTLIESTQYGSNEKCSSVLDSAELAKDINLIDRRIDEIDRAEHFTRITITKLRHQYQKKTVTKLIEKISKFYRNDIVENNVKILINNQAIYPEDPKIKVSEETGSQILEFFDGKFLFGQSEYGYHGWCAILDKANVSDAGFSLYKANRVIKESYRPELIFKKPNSFEYQRVIGTIHLDDFPVVSDKTDFIWTNGLEDAFLDALKNNKEVKSILTQANKLRVRKTVIDEKKMIKNIRKDEGYFKSLANVKKTPMIGEKKDQNEAPAYLDSLSAISDMSLKFESIDYKFEFVFKHDEKHWLRVETKDESKGHYVLIINPTFKLFTCIGKQQDREMFINRLSVLFALAQLSSANNGFKESYKFVNKINEIIRYLGDSNE